MASVRTQIPQLRQNEERKDAFQIKENLTTGYPVWKIALVIHITGWILQFIGHGVFDGRAPALLDSLDQVNGI